jgi:hypothetical protein
MGIFDRIAQAARDFMGEDERQSPRRSYENIPEPQTTAFGTIDQHGNPRSRSYTTPTTPPPAGGAQDGAQSDEEALERYRYLLRTAPPEAIEQVHAEAFAKLTEPQRQQVLADLSAGLSAYERPSSADPQTMARAATRAEYLRPGTMERTLGGRQGSGFGAMVGGSLLGTVAGHVIGSALMSSFLAPAFASDGGEGDSGETSTEPAAGDAGADASAASGDLGGLGDFGGFDF